MKKIPMTAAALLAACGPVLADDPYEGVWAGTECGKGIQCKIEINKVGTKAYQLRFVVADRVDARKIRCEISTSMERGPLEFTAGNHYKDGLIGDFPDGVVWIRPRADGDLSLTTLQKCRGVEIYGDYGFIGD